MVRRLRGAPMADRLMFRVEFDTAGGCWLWSGATTPDGYGSINCGARSNLAHRVSWTVFRGDPGALCVLHRCDIPACVNPDHLFLGTNADNVKDRVTKGRSSGGSHKGLEHPNVRLSPADVKRIRTMAAARMRPQRLIAAQYGISQGHVSTLLHEKRWRP